MRVNLNLVQGIKRISNTAIPKRQPMKKLANSSLLKTLENPLLVFSKGARDQNINKYKNRNLKDLENELENGEISKEDYDNAVKKVKTYYDTAKKTPAKIVSSKDVRQKTQSFKGREDFNPEDSVPLHEANLNDVDIDNLNVALPMDLQEMLKKQGIELLDEDCEFLIEKLYYGITHGENFSEVFRDFIENI